MTLRGRGSLVVMNGSIALLNVAMFIWFGHHWWSAAAAVVSVTTICFVVAK